MAWYTEIHMSFRNILLLLVLLTASLFVATRVLHASSDIVFSEGLLAQMLQNPFSSSRNTTPQSASRASFFCIVTPPDTFGVKKVNKEQTKLKAVLLDGASRAIKKGNSDYQKEKSSARLQELQRKAGERKKYLKQMMRSDPNAAAQAVVAPDERATLSETSQNCVEEPTIVEGELEVRHADYADGSSEEDYILKTVTGEQLKIHPTSGLSEELLSGTQIRVKGLRIDDDVLFDGSFSASQPNGDLGGVTIVKQVGNPPVLGDQRTIVLMMNFQNTLQPTLTRATVQDAVFTQANNYYTENSYNKAHLSGDVIDWIRLPVSQTCNALAVESASIRAADSLVDFRQYSRLIVIAPFTTCGWAGLGSYDKLAIDTQDGIALLSMALVDSRYVNGGTIEHELGHNFGNSHASFYSCGSASVSGACGIVEYEDFYDVMGGSTRRGHFNAPHKDFVGWFSSSNILNVSASGTYVLEPIETATDGLKALKIRRSSSNYLDYLFVEYRQPIGFDTSFNRMSGTDVFEGALLHTHRAGSAHSTLLIDPTPPGNPWASALPVGGVFADPESGVRIEVLSVMPDGLTVDVRLGMTDFTAPFVAISSPVSNSSVFGNVRFSARASDVSGIARVEFYRSGTMTPFAVDAIAPFEGVLVNTSQMPNGPFSIYARAYDNAGAQWGIQGNTSNSLTVSYNLANTDASLPIVEMTAPIEGVVVQNPVTFLANASDNIGIWKTEFFEEGQGVPFLITTNSETTSRNTIVWPVGRHRVYAKAFDFVGNSTNSSVVTFTIEGTDVTPPTVSMSSPAAGTMVSGRVSVSASPADNIGIARVEFYNDAETTPFGVDQTSPIEVFLDTTLLTNGTHTLYARAYDVATNSTVSARTFVIVDNILPTITLTSPTEGSTVAGIFSLNVSATDNSAMQRIDFYRDEDILLGSDTTRTLRFFVNSTSLSNGAHTFYARVFDVAGNSTTSRPVSITVNNAADTMSPSVYIIRPESGTVLSGAVDLAVSANDLVGVSRVDFYRDNGILLGTDMTAPYSIVWNSALEANGRHALYVTATDNAGNSATSVTIVITTNNDTTGPNVTFTAPLSGALVRGMVNFALAASDIAGITRTQISGFNSVGVMTALSPDTVSPYGAALNSATLIDGAYVFNGVAVDTAGNIGTTTPLTITFDNTPPSVTLNSPPDAPLSGPVLFTASTTDAYGIERVEFYRNNTTLIGIATTSPYVLLWNSGSVNNGNHSFTARARDLAGNQTTSLPLTLSIYNDKTLPVISYSVPRYGSLVSGVASIVVNARDNIGVQRVMFFKDAEPAPFSVDENAPFGAELDTSMLNPGLHTLKSVAYDAAGNAKSATVSILVDNVPPTVSMQTPQLDVSVSGTSVPISAIASDVNGIARVEFYRDESMLIGIDTGTPFGVTWNSFTASNGAHTLFAKAFDRAGNSSVSTSIPVQVNNVADAIAPTVLLSTPRNGTRVRGTISVTANGRDDKGLASVSFFNDTDLSPFAVDSLSPFATTLNTELRNDGPLVLRALATDGAGNTGTSTPVTVTVDNTPPVLMLASIQNGAALSGIITLSADASDTSGISRVEFYRDNNVRLSSDLLAPYTYAWNTTYTTVGAHTLYAKAYDKAGNVVASTPIPVTIAR